MAERSPGHKLREGDIQIPRQCLQREISLKEDGCLGQGTQSKLSAVRKKGHSGEAWGFSLYHPASWATAPPPFLNNPLSFPSAHQCSPHCGARKEGLTVNREGKGSRGQGWGLVYRTT